MWLIRIRISSRIFLQHSALVLASTTMKLFGLLSLVVATTLGMKLKEPVVNEVIDMVESGLGDSKEGRALFITLTLTESTWSANSPFTIYIPHNCNSFRSVTTVTSDVTTAPAVFCIATSIAECTTAAAARCLFLIHPFREVAQKSSFKLHV